MNSEIINAKIEKRILMTDVPIFSGETVKIRLEIDAADAVASNHKIVLFGDDKKALAEGTFTASESAWIADLNTATREMAAYFADVPADATKSLGAMVVNTSTADVITRGNVLAVCTPFPNDLIPCPQTFAYLTEDEFSSSMAEVESEISGKQPVIDAPPKIFDNWGQSGNETKRITVTPSNYFDFERSRYTCGNWGEGVKKLVFDFSGIKSQTDIEVVDIRLYMYVCGEALPTDVFYIDGFDGMDSFDAWNGASTVRLSNAIDFGGNYAYAIDVHYNETYGLMAAQIIGRGEY